MYNRNNDNLFESFFYREYKKLYGHIFGWIRNHSNVEDILQEAFYDLYKQQGDEVEPYSRSLLYAIAKKKVLKMIHRQELRDKHDQQWRVNPMQTRSFQNIKQLTPEDLLIDKERRRLAKERFQLSLTDRDQKCLELRCNGYSYEEVAEELKISPRIVGMVISRAREKLKRVYKKGKSKK